MKYRVIEQADLNGEVCFFPQYQRFFVWLCFYDFDFPPKQIKFYSLESATRFIRKQQNKPKTKIYSIE
jgi:hypothetical protein